VSDLLSDPYFMHRLTAREGGRTCSPFRLGVAVGAAGADLPPPYAPGSRAARSYRAGVEWGRQRMLRPRPPALAERAPWERPR
jgi:hypothetical protein